MLSLRTRPQYQTLLDAETLTDADDRPAIVFLSIGQEPVTVSRAEFKRHVEQNAADMISIGLGQGDLVLIAHTQNLESVFLFWGAIRCGAIPSMFSPLTEKLDPAVYARNMAELVNLSDVKAVFTSEANRPILEAAARCPVYTPQDGRLHSAEVELGEKVPPPSDIAFLQHSSGTTGLQKGVALSHEAVLNQLAAYADSLFLGPTDRIVSWLPLYHDMGLIAGFVQPIVQGIPLILMSPFEWVRAPAMLLRAISTYKGTLCWLPNFAYNHMARRVRRGDLEQVDLSSMRSYINCSEPVHHDSHQQFLNRFEAYGVSAGQLGVSYAMAENTFAVTQTTPGFAARVDTIDAQRLIEDQQAILVPDDHPQATRQVSCGRPIENTQVSVTDHQGNRLPERAVGQLFVQSDCMLTEYYMRDDLSPFDEYGWYQTGDMGYLAEGEVFVIGRQKDLIINAGKNVYPQDIEAIANTVAGIKPGRTVCFGVFDDREGTELIALLAESEVEDDRLKKEIVKRIKQTVVQQTTISLTYVELVSPRWLLKTSSGKIARTANKNKWLAGRQRK